MEKFAGQTNETETDLTARVCAALIRVYDIPATYEYPGFIAIPERCINDDEDGSDAVWACGPSDDGSDSWTGQLMSADGTDCLGEQSFTVWPRSTDAEEIAIAIYTHGIGDLYVGGGCSDVDCPRRRVASVPS